MNTTLFDGVWSAAPTPFTVDYRIDIPSIERLTEHHLRLGVKGVFLAGSCGEGPWLTEAQKSTLVRETVKAANGRLGIAVQVTDNSAARVLDNIARAEDDGAEYAVVAAPFFLMHATPKVLLKLYEKVFDESTLPIVFYDRGKHSAIDIPAEVLKRIYLHPRVAAIKDSSSDPVRMQIAVQARDENPSLRLLTGDEFDVISALRLGYDGLMLGGAAFNGYVAKQIYESAHKSDWKHAENLQRQMNRLMFEIYGREIQYWLAGEKYLLQKWGVFGNHDNLLGYALTEEQQKTIDHIAAYSEKFFLPEKVFFHNGSSPVSLSTL